MLRLFVVFLGFGAVVHAEEAGVSFSRDIAPILLHECITCHSAEKAKGGYRLHTFEAALQAGKSKAEAVVPGKPEESELYRRLVAPDEDDRMPQDDDPLTEEQIALVRKWIAEGAKLDQGAPQSGLATLLPKAFHPAPPEFYPRPLPLLAVAFTPGGERIVTSGYHEILFWNLAGQLEKRITNMPQRVHSISFHPNGTVFAIAGGRPGKSGELTVFDAKGGQVVTNLVLSADELITVAFSPDGKLLAGGGSDNAIHVFATEDWTKVTTIQQHADWVTSVAFDQDGSKILSGSRDRTARIYGASSGELEMTYQSHIATIHSVTFLTGDKVASAGREGAVHIWDIAEGKRRHDIGGVGTEVYELVSDGQFLFVASVDQKVRQFSTEDRKLVRTYSGLSDAVYCVAYHAGSGKLAAGSYDGTVKIWNTKDGTLESTFVAAPLDQKQANHR